MSEALEALRALADELAAFDCVEDEVPRGIDVPDDYEAGLHDAARRLRTVLASAPRKGS